MELDLYNNNRKDFTISSELDMEWKVTKFNTETEEVFIEEFFMGYLVGNGFYESIHMLNENEKMIFDNNIAHAFEL